MAELTDDMEAAPNDAALAGGEASGVAVEDAQSAAAGPDAPDGAAANGTAGETTESSAPDSDAEPAGALAAVDRSALLRPGLSVQVQVLVLGKREIDEKNRRISDDGTLALPLVGAVKVDGMSIPQLIGDLTERYGDFFLHPQVLIDYVVEPGSDAISPWGQVTVLGRVKMPGRVNIPPTRDLTISAAIQNAGGLDTSGKDSAIRVTRRLEDGTSEIIDVDLRAVGSRGKRGNDLILRDGDVVFVPQMIF